MKLNSTFRTQPCIFAQQMGEMTSSPIFFAPSCGRKLRVNASEQMTSKCHEFTNKITAFVTSLLSMSYVIYTDGGYVIKT